MRLLQARAATLKAGHMVVAIALLWVSVGLSSVEAQLLPPRPSIDPGMTKHAAPQPFAPSQPGKLVIYRGATLIDGTGSAARPNMAVVVDGDRIREVVPTRLLTADLLARAEVVDLEGRYILPGLIDSHHHLATPPNPAAAKAQMRRAIYGGITAMRDMADDLRLIGELTRAARVGEIPGPDLYYAAFMAGPSFYSDWRTLVDAQGTEPDRVVPWLQSITDQTDMPQAIAVARGTYATGVKIYSDLPAHLVRNITAEAHRQGLKVWSHGMVFPTRPSEVIASGVDSISHICSLAYEAMDQRPQNWAERNSFRRDPERMQNGGYALMAQLFREMRRRNIILDATLRIAVDTPEEARRKAGRPQGCPSEVATRMMQLAYREGVSISTGTDFYSNWSDPYPSLHQELVLLAEAGGMPPAQVIRSATLVGAMSIGQEANMGTIEPGKLANMVVLAKNPLEDMNNIRFVVMTVKRGRRLDRADYIPIRRGEVPEDQ